MITDETMDYIAVAFEKAFGGEIKDIKDSTFKLYVSDLSASMDVSITDEDICVKVSSKDILFFNKKLSRNEVYDMFRRVVCALMNKGDFNNVDWDDWSYYPDKCNKLFMMDAFEEFKVNF